MAEDGVAVEAEFVVSLDIILDPGALRQIHVARRESIVHAEFSRQFTGNVPVAGAGHAYIGFGQQQNVASAEIGVAFEGLQLPLVFDTALEVPGQKAVPFAGRGFGRCEGAGFGGIEYTRRRRRDFLVDRVRQQFGRVAAGSQRREVRN